MTYLHSVSKFTMSLRSSLSRSESSGLFNQARTAIMTNDAFELQFGEEVPTAMILDTQRKDVNYRDIANCSVPVFLTRPIYQMSYVMESPTLRQIQANVAVKSIICGISSPTGRMYKTASGIIRSRSQLHGRRTSARL